MDKSTNNAQLAVTPPLAHLGAAGGTGSALFVINLCASIAPARLDGNNIPGLENYRLYQVARVEDGRTRHRLRLGFFTSEKHAESVLTVVRQQYPTAFTACLCEEDRRFARGYLPEGAATQPKPAAVQPRAAAGQPKPAAPATVTRQAPAAAKTLAVGPTDGLDEFSWEPPSLTPAADAAIARTNPAGVVKARVATSDKSTSDTAKHPALKLAPKAPAAKAAAPVVAKPAAPVAARPATKPAAPPMAAAAIKPDTASSMRVRAPNLTISDPPPAPVQAQRAAPSAPFHVGKGVQLKDTGIRLEAESAAPAKPAVTAKPAVPVKPAVQAKPKNGNAPVATKPVMTPAPVFAAKVPEKAAKPAYTPAAPVVTAKPAAPPIRITGSAISLPELDSTQTIRALTSAEMEDQQQDKWFAVQLAVSDQPVNLDLMPRLDIFEAYRLYTVATAGSGKIVHSLRLGFFKEAVSAEAVSGYLKTFFGSPTIMRVSVAEHARFKDPPSSRKPAAPAHEAKVVELNNARTARPVVPTVTMEVAPGVDTAATGSFRSLDTGSFKTSATGTHKALKGAAKSAGPNTKRAPARTGNTGKHRTLPPVEKRSLAEQLLDEAREVQLSESGIRKLPKNDSLISRMLGKLTK